MHSTIVFGLLAYALSGLSVLAAPQSFQANTDVSNSISLVLNHVKTSIKTNNPKHIAGTFPPDEGSKERVNVFTDLPVNFP